jgi:hypothetical protein
MRAIGDLLARGVRRLQELKGHDIRRRGGDEEILAVDPATCLDLQAESSVTVGHAASLADNQSPGHPRWSGHDPLRVASRG